MTKPGGGSTPREPGRTPLTRRQLIPAAAATAFVPDLALGLDRRAPAAAGQPAPTAACTSVPSAPAAKRPIPQAHWQDFSEAETLLGFRNHGMFAEVLREPVTPLGAHYLLIHFDVPQLSDENYTLTIAGRVSMPLQIGLGELKTRPSVTQLVTLECAGTGRILLKPRPVYVPWGDAAVGTYRWTGTPLRPLLEQAGLLDDAAEILFSGWDTGVDLGVEHAFERSLPVADALRPEVMLAWAANDQPLLPEHGFPLRLIVPSWYGVASVKWLRAITALSAPFMGVQQAQAYRYRQTHEELGEPVREKRLISLMVPPGIPDMMSRCRFIAPGQHVLQGRAWSGGAPVAKVEVSTDDGESWSPTELSRVSDDPFAWVGWQASWGVKTPGHYTLTCRATDAAGSTQPLDPREVWNVEGNGINAIRKVQVVVQEGIGGAGMKVPSVPRPVLAEAKLPPAAR